MRIFTYMKSANIYIQGVIGENTTLIDVIRQTESQKEADVYNVYITSPGGLIEEGFDIYNYLVNLGKPVTTYARGNCDSIATVIFQAGAKRYIDENIQSFVIHNAHINPALLGTTVDANALKQIEQELRSQEDKITNFYTSKTKLSFDTLDKLMDKDSNLTAKDVVGLGFADSTFSDLKAAALVFTKEQIETDNKNDSIMNKLEQSVKNIWSFLLKKTSNQFFMKLADGTEVYIDSEDGDFIGKDVYMVEGGEITSTPAPDGEHELATGKVLTTEGGKVVSLTGGVEEEGMEEEKPEAMEETIEETIEDSNNMTEEEMEEKMQALINQGIENGMKELENKLTAMFSKQGEALAENRTQLDSEYAELKTAMRGIVTNFNIPANAGNHKDGNHEDKVLTQATPENLRAFRERLRANKA